MRAINLTGAAILLAGGILAGCGGGGGSSTTGATATGATSAKARIERNWKAFFNGKTSAGSKLPLLENGQRYRKVIAAQSGSTLADQTRAKVSKVTIAGPNTARVTYTILVGSKPALKNRKGKAVKRNGTWKVSDQSFCQLLSLEGTAPAGCAGG